LALWEYETFVNQRYTVNCAARVSVAQSVEQWLAFTQLACYTCLEEWSANSTSVPLTALPDCCLPFNNSRIAICAMNTTTTSSSSGSNNNHALVIGEQVGIGGNGRVRRARVCLVLME
jgi:hypothetical protein